MKVCGACTEEIEMKPLDQDHKSSDAEPGDESAGSTVVELDGTRKPSSSNESVAFTCF